MDVKRAFDLAAREYDRERWQLVPCLDDLYGTVLELLPFPPDAPIEVLDLGAGTGLLAGTIAAAFPRASLTLVDLSDAMLARARERFADAGERVRFLTLDLARDPLPGRYDAVVSSLAIHHLSPEERRALFGRVRAAVRPGGVFVNADQVLGPTPELERRYRAAWLRAVEARGASPDTIARALERMRFDRESRLDEQLGWLREVGFEQVDCWFKRWEFVVMAGAAPDAAERPA